jgi:hypothetical protein
MAVLTPHPLVMDVALRLTQKDVGTLRVDAAATLPNEMPAAVQNAVAAEQAAAESRDPRAQEAAARDRAAALRDLTDKELADAFDQAKAPDEQNRLATALANQANVADVSLFAGFLGGEIEHEGKTWRLVYLDSRLSSWMLAPQDAIVVSQRLEDKNAPSGVRDVLWVDSTANLITGSGPRTNDGRFLVGELTRAGDYAPSTSGGTFSAASGLLCEATTPGCCMYTRTRC